jgi:2-haloacid dehalogenase
MAIYEKHARDFGLTPEASIFIDDSYPNVEGARAAGWHAVHFTDPETLRKALRDHGIEV